MFHSQKKGEKMKKVLVFAFVLLGSASLCSTAFGSIQNSAHDFSNSNWAAGQICLPCHAPHNNQNQTGALLWNHDVTEAQFTLYSSPSFDGVDSSGQPGGVSKLCLSCHDGTVAIDAFGGATGGTMISGDRMLGTDLSNDHPISFTYDSALASTDGELLDPGSLPDTIKLFAGKMECASCHDVHDKNGNETLLNVANAGSALCLTCHLK